MVPVIYYQRRDQQGVPIEDGEIQLEYMEYAILNAIFRILIDDGRDFNISLAKEE